MSQASVSSRIKELKRNMDDPAVGLEHIKLIHNGLLHDDPKVRFDSADILISMSAVYPDQLRELVPQVCSRLDDENADVRAQAIALVYNLSRWYPQDFEHTTELLHNSIKNGTTEQERAIAVGALSHIALYRPDVLTSREAVQESLINYMDNADAQDLLNQVGVDPDIVKEAIPIVETGDMSSRPIENDLSSTPDSTSWSTPARVGFKWIFRGMLLPIWYIVLVLTSLRFSYRFRHRTMGGRARILFAQYRKLKFMTDSNRRSLYFRASMWPTASQVFPMLPSCAPIEANRHQQTGPLPEDWHIRARLIRERDGYVCRNCGVGGGPNGNAELHVDHQNPRSVGGSNEPDNLRTLCRDCHEARHARVFES